MYIPGTPHVDSYNESVMSVSQTNKDMKVPTETPSGVRPCRLMVHFLFWGQFNEPTLEWVCVCTRVPACAHVRVCVCVCVCVCVGGGRSTTTLLTGRHLFNLPDQHLVAADPLSFRACSRCTSRGCQQHFGEQTLLGCLQEG